MEKTVTVVLADSSRARFFSVGDHRGQAGRIEPELVERLDLVQAGRRAHASETLGHAGSRRSGAGVKHAVDDHRDSRTEEGDRQFAGEVIAELRRFDGDNPSDEIVVCAPARFVGHLRAGGPPASFRFVTLEISDLSAPRALAHLTKHGHLKLSA